VRLDATGAAQAAVLVLPGGAETSLQLTRERQLAGLRMLPIARALHAAGRRQGLAVWMVRYRYRGWNGEQMSPVPDTRWALDAVRRELGAVPVALVGHSMGGRVAMRVAGDDAVRVVVGLAPWLPDGESPDGLAGRELVLAHGTLDRITSPRATRRFAERAAAAGAAVASFSVRGDTHAMLLRWPTWHRLAVDAVVGGLGLRATSARLEAAFRRGQQGEFSVPV
jgi:alpha-beta hydrolase superfamily lysophospholipase